MLSFMVSHKTIQIVIKVLKSLFFMSKKYQTKVFDCQQSIRFKRALFGCLSIKLLFNFNCFLKILRSEYLLILINLAIARIDLFALRLTQH